MKQHGSHSLLFSICLLFASNFLFGQIEFKLEYLQAEDAWGVFARHNGTGGLPSIRTVTGSGQVTIVVPHEYELGTLTSVSGDWTRNAAALAPIENPARDYLSYGFLQDRPPIVFNGTDEVLLFKIQKIGICPDTLYLIDSQNDPFADLPNSAHSNPGNDLGVFDLLSGAIYTYSGLYAREAWNCGPVDPQNPPLTLTATVDHPDCRGGNTGKITLDLQGGKPPYQVRWNHGDTNPTADNLIAGTYTATVTDAEGASLTQSFIIEESTSTCIWPGDANLDGIVNSRDLIAIGVGYGKQGPARNAGTMEWKAQSCADWNYRAPLTQINLKHADATGDGIVDRKDLAAVNLNWYKTHKSGENKPARPANPNTEAIPLYLKGSKIDASRSKVQLPIILGDALKNSPEVYALSFSMHYDPTAIVPGSVKVDVDQSWLKGDAETLITLQMDQPEASKIEVALSRTDQVSLSGKGVVGVLSFEIRPELKSAGIPAHPLLFSFSDVYLINHKEEVLPSESRTSFAILETDRMPDLTENKNTAEDILIYPNPARTVVFVDSPGLPVQRMTIRDMTGSQLISETPSYFPYQLDISALPHGLYLFELETDTGLLVRKLAISGQ